MRVLILADVPGWIVDRCTDRMIAGMPAVQFEKGHYCCLHTDEILELARDVDLIHYQNWDIERHWPRILDAGRPVLMGVRSFRFPSYVREVAKRVNVHVVAPGLLKDFPQAEYVPDGIDDRFFAPLRVGYAGKDCKYKGVDLIEAACRLTGAVFAPAFDLPFEAMPDYYRSIDVLVCASQAEGFGTPVMEALAMGTPVISVRTGAAWDYRPLPVVWVDRTAAAIAAGLGEFQRPNLAEFRWSKVCARFEALYRRLCTT